MSQILLDVGTNEVEIMELIVGNGRYGVNVAKIREIVPLEDKTITPLPDSPHNLRGVLMLRSRTVPIVDLALTLGASGDNNDAIAIVCEMNGHEVGFLAGGVKEIHRLSWASLQPLGYLERFEPPLTGTVLAGETPLMVLDLEKIVGDLIPETRLNYLDVPESGQDVRAKREAANLWIVDDSRVIRRFMVSLLAEAGYVTVKSFHHGKEVVDAIMGGEEPPDMLVSDIEMPQLDGLTLCKRIKDGSMGTSFPVVMFSSLVQEDTGRKCRAVGADAWLAKPQLPGLVALVDAIAIGEGEIPAEFLRVNEAA